MGHGMYHASRLFNHSCAPNCIVSFMGTTIRISASSAVTIGQELTISYGPLSSRVSYYDRQKLLQTRYCFTCTCHACRDERKRPKHTPRLYICRKCDDGAINSQQGIKCTGCMRIFSADEAEMIRNSLSELLHHREQSMRALDEGNHSHARRSASAMLKLAQQFMHQEHPKLGVRLYQAS